jgi:hypothetical protein
MEINDNYLLFPMDCHLKSNMQKRSVDSRYPKSERKQADAFALGDCYVNRSLLLNPRERKPRNEKTHRSGFEIQSSRGTPPFLIQFLCECWLDRKAVVITSPNAHVVIVLLERRGSIDRNAQTPGFFALGH